MLKYLNLSPDFIAECVGQSRQVGSSGYNAPSTGGENRTVLRFICSATVTEFVVSPSAVPDEFSFAPFFS